MAKVPGPYVRFLQENDKVAQYSIPGEPQQNRVAKRINRILMDMVDSMISYSTLQLIFSKEYQVSRCPKRRMSCGQKEYPH